MNSLPQTYRNHNNIEISSGVFAVALSRFFASSKIGIITTLEKPNSSRSIRFYVAHAFCVTHDDKIFDIRWRRTIEEITHDLKLRPSQFEIRGPYPPIKFQSFFMGDNAKYPLDGGDEDIDLAMEYIKENTFLYK